MKVFFSHASEDKAVVEQIYLRVISKYPNIKGWLDKYEILGGDDLIEKLNLSIDNSDKFLVFLSPNSIDKPWVRAELRKALMKELSGVNPEFIIPVKMGKISSFPPFLESKYYIDIESKTEAEWLEEIYAGITRQPKQLGKMETNLNVSLHLPSDTQQGVIILFEAGYWAEEVGFIIKTSEKIKKRMWTFPKLKGMQSLSISEIEDDDTYAIKIQNLKIERTNPFYIGIEFENAIDPRSKIISIKKWNGENGRSSIQFIEFNNV